MSAFNLRSVAVTAASVVMAASLVACESNRLSVNTRKDGSLAFVAEELVTKDEATGGIEADEYQGLAIDPSKITSGSMHVKVLLLDEENDIDSTDEAGESSDTDSSSSKATDKSADGNSSDETTDGTSNKKRGVPSIDTSEAIAGKVSSPSSSTSSEEASDAETDEGDDTPSYQNALTVFSRTFSYMDTDAGIVSITDIEEGYYTVVVTADHARGTLVVRSYDLTDEEITDREAHGAYQKVKDFFKDLNDSFSGSSASGAVEDTQKVAKDARKATEDIKSEAESL